MQSGAPGAGTVEVWAFPTGSRSCKSASARWNRIYPERGKSWPLFAGARGELRPEQAATVEELLRHETGVLVAPPGAGKTVIACALIAERRVPTAILVNRADLLPQWRTRLTEFLSITDKQIGQLGGGRRKRRGIVDVIMMQSIAHRAGDPFVLEQYGQVIVDECHAIAGPAVEAAIREVSVRNWVGLTATPYGQIRWTD